VKFFFDKTKNVYNFVNREVSTENRQYPNIKFYMKTMLSDDIYYEARKMFHVFCNNFWLKNVKITTVSANIIKYISEQCEFWKNEYNILYENNKQLKILLNEKKVQKEKNKKRLMM